MALTIEAHPRDRAGMGFLERLDGFVNAITGLGTSRDRLTGAQLYSTRATVQQQGILETLYYENDLCASIVDAIVDDSMRQGIELERAQTVGEDDDGETVKRQAEAMLRRADDLGAISAVDAAARFGRLYGGGAVFLVMDDGANEQPLKLGRRIVSTMVLHRWELTPSTYYTDPMKPRYGEVEVWRANPSGVSGAANLLIHESRLLPFYGLPVSRDERTRQNGWSLSVLTRVYDVIRDVDQNWRSVSNILSQSTQPIFKILGLASMVANGQDEVLTRRMAAANLGRSALNAVLIDSEGEEFRYENASLSGLDVILDKSWQRAAAAARMPVTRLMGMSPAGLNATGASDIRGWYDSVQAYREGDLGPQLRRLFEVIAAELGDTAPGEWAVAWPSLWQMSPTEEATHRKTIADTDAVYIDKGVVLPEEVAVTRFGGGGYSDGPVQIDTSLRETPTEVVEAPAMPTGEVAPGTWTEPTAETAAPVTDPELAKDPAAALNGAQVASLQEIVQSVARRELPRDSGIAMILAAFPLELEQAERIMGPVGVSFFATPDAPSA